MMLLVLALFITLVSNVAVGYENNGYSHLELAADPGIVHPILTKSLKLRCSVKINKLQNERTYTPSPYNVSTTSQLVLLNDTTVQTVQSTIHSSKSRGEAEFRKLLSLVLTKKNKETGLNETLASVTGCESPVTESKYAGAAKVEGNTEGSPREGEQGFITLTLESPLEEQAGEFYCEASALNSEKHSVKLISSLEIQAIEPRISDLVNYISTNDKHIFDLKSKVLELYEENQILKNHTTTLAKENIDLKYKIDLIETPMFQSGSAACHSQFISFNPAFNNAPTIITSFASLGFYSQSNYATAMSVGHVTANNFYLICDAKSFSHAVSVNWLAVGF